MQLTKHRKCQIIFACCIPFFGFLFVIFNSWLYLKKYYGCKYFRQMLFYVFCIPALIVGLVIMALLYKYVIYPFSPSWTVVITVTILTWFIIFIGVGFAVIGVEKLYLRIYFKDLPQNQNATELL